MLVPESEFLKLPVIALGGLEANLPTQYNAWQRAMAPYLEGYQMALWFCFWTALAIVIIRFFLIPLKQKWTKDSDFASAGNLRTAPLPCANRIICWYRRLFFLDEVSNDVVLRLFGGALLFGYFVTYERWMYTVSTTVDAIKTGKHVCWPVFQSCGDFLWLRTLPLGYSQTILFMVLFGVMALGVYGLLARRVTLAHGCILLLFVAKIYFVAMNFSYNGNYDYYHNIFNIVFLFLPYKRFFGSLSVVIFYFLSTQGKIHPGWTMGTYFSSLRTGLPIFPKGMEPLWTNLVIFMEMIMSWFLFSRQAWLQRTVFLFFCVFHLYSGTLVGYFYPMIVMPPLVIFFGPLFKPFPSVPLGYKSIPCWIVIAILLCLQMEKYIIPGDAKLTLEGNFYGLYMFEANHQCRVTLTKEDGTLLSQQDSANARNRCNPYEYMARAQLSFCQVPVKPKIGFSEIHSINGGPFYKIVNESDLCSLQYNAFTQNEWIKDETTAPMVGRPNQNYYQ